ncbi:MAG: beta-propeller fold lactonase family protein [Acidobacteriota bacterium]
MKKIFLLTLLALLVSAFRITPVGEVKVGNAPTYAALSPDGGLLYVTNFASDEVKVIDTTRRRVVATFYAGYEPLGIAVNPSGTKIFVTNYSNGLVKVVDAKTYQILDDIKVSGIPSNVVISPNGAQAFVTNFGRGKIGRVDFIDTTSHDVTGEIEIGVRPLAAAVSLLGDYLYVICGGSDELYVIDIADKKVIQKMAVGHAPDGIALSPDGNTLYVSNSRTNDISVIDLLDLRETRRVSVGKRPWSLDVSREGNIFVVETGDKAVSVLTPDFQKVATFKVKDKPIDIQLSPDDRFAYVTDEKDNKVFIFEISRP